MTSRTIIIVGASRGIGKALVELFSADNTNTVYALSRNLSKMSSDFNHLKNVVCQGIDLAGNDVEKQMEACLDEIDHIDIMINNAGFLVNKPFAELTNEDISTSYRVNVIGVMQSVQAAVKKMSNSHIVNISSMGGFQGSVKFSGLSAYSTSKAALCSFTELFAEEYKETNIKMNCLCLGAVQTEMLSEAFPGYEAPMGPEEMAEFIMDFAIKGHRWMNGKIIPVSLSTP